jgi:uncharacterized protein
MGQLLRLLIILVVVWLVIQIIRRAFTPPSRRARPAITKMVACAHCGVHVPESEAVWDGERSYCSQEHLNAAGR